jgi:hypothetical protein
MPMLWQKLEFLFNRGLDTKRDEKLAQGMLALKNGRFAKGGTIETRLGFGELSRRVGLDGSEIASGSSLAVLAGELLQLARGRLLSWSENVEAWIDKGGVSNLHATLTPVYKNTYTQSNPDAARAGGFALYAWADTRGGVYLRVVDEATGTETLADSLVDAEGSLPRCIAIDDRLFVCYVKNHGGVASFCASYVDARAPDTIVALGALEANVFPTQASQRLDVCESPLAHSAVFAYTKDATHVFVGFLKKDGTIGSGATFFPDPATLAIDATAGLEIDFLYNSFIYVLHATAVPSVRVLSLTGALAIQHADVLVEAADAVQVTMAESRQFEGSIEVYYEVTAALAYNHSVRRAVIDGVTLAVTSGPADLRRSVGLAAQAFLHDDTVHVPLLHDSSPAAATEGLQNTYFLATGDGTIVGRIASGTADRLQQKQLPSVLAVDAENFFWLAPVRTQFATGGGLVVSYSLVGLARVDLEFSVRTRFAQAGEGLLLSGGVLGYFDGQSVTELGYHLFPENFSGVSAAGGSLEAGRRSFVVVWTFYDAKGQRHQSAPSQPLQIDSALNEKVTLTIPTLRLTDKIAPRTNVQALVYSTDADGTIYRLTPNGDATTPNTGIVYNDPTVDTITFVRKVADAGIQSFEELYTEGGVLENDTPGAASLLASTKQRTFVAGTEIPRRTFLTKQVLPTFGPEFSDALYFDTDASGGDPTAIAAMDEKLVVFKPSQIEIVEGEGPDTTGANGSFSIPGLLTVDVGCAAPDSIAVTPAGLVFQSAKGIYLLTRSLETQYVGAPVEAYNDRVITGAVLVADRNEVWFVASDVILVWNYFFNTWDVNEITGLSDAVALVLWQDRLAILDADGTVFVESSDSYVDENIPVRMTLGTEWIKTAGLQGFQRVRRAHLLGDYFSAHRLRIRVAYDYQPFFSETHTFDPSTGAIVSTTFGDDTPFGDPEGEPFGGSADTVYQFRFRLGRQKCQAVRFEVVVLGSTPGKAVSLTALSLEWGEKRGLRKLRGAKTIS